MDHRPIDSDTLDDDAVRAFLTRYLAAWNGHDVDAICALITDDILWQDPTIPGGEARGHAAVRAWLAPLWRAFPDLTFAFLDGADEHAPDSFYRSTGQRLIAVPWRCRGTLTGVLPPGFAPTGRAVDLVGTDFYGFRGDRLCQVRTFTDGLAALQQLGLLPAHDSRGERVMVTLHRAASRLGGWFRRS